MFQLQNIDREIVDSVEVEFVVVPIPISGFPIGVTGPVPIQFPPRVTDDTKTANWQEKDVKSYEPVAIWMGATARKVSIEFDYVVTGTEGFTTSGIAEISKQFKAYFYRSVQPQETTPIVKINIYNHTTGGQATFRLLDVTVSHPSETLIQDNDGIWPLLTKIKVSAMLMTNISDKSGKTKQNIPNLPDRPEVGWY